MIACFSFTPLELSLVLSFHSWATLVFCKGISEEMSCLEYSPAKNSRHATNECLNVPAKSHCSFLDLSCPIIWRVFLHCWYGVCTSSCSFSYVYVRMVLLCFLYVIGSRSKIIPLRSFSHTCSCTQYLHNQILFYSFLPRIWCLFILLCFLWCPFSFSSSRHFSSSLQ